MQTLNKVVIKSFKSIISQELELGRLNVIVGSNGAGKSNLLEAIGMLSSSVSGEIDYSRLSERGMRLSSPEVFRSAFRNINRKNTFSLDAYFNDFHYHVNINSNQDESHPWSYLAEKFSRGAIYDQKIAGRSNRGATVGDTKIDKLSDVHSVAVAAEALGGFIDDEIECLDHLKKYAIYSPSTPILRGVSIDGSSKSPLGLYGGSLAESLNDVLGDSDVRGELSHFFTLLDWFKSIGVSKPDSILQSKHLHTSNFVVKYSDKFMKTNFNKLYAYDVSEGALYILFVLVLLTHKESPSFFALDNIDNSLNPGLVTSLMSYISKALETSNKQIIMTTHNPTTLDALDLFNDDHRLFVAKRGKNGGSVFQRIKPEEKMTRDMWAEKYYGMKLSEIWLSGALGGLPTDGF